MQAPTFAQLVSHFVGPWVRSIDPPGPTLYVDAFAGAEWQHGAGGSQPAGAVRAALQALGSGAAAVLVEEDPVLAARLEATLRSAGHAPRAADPGGLEAGQVTVLQADFAAVADLVAAVPAGTRTLLAAAPPTARRIRWELLEAFLADPAAELLFRFPVADLLRQDAYTDPLADLPPFARRVVDGCSGVLGDARHGWVAAWRATRRTYGTAAATEEAMQAFAARLASAAGERLAKAIHMAGEEGGERVFLVAGDPLAALALNAAVVSAGGTAGAPAEVAGAASGPACDLFGAPLAAPPRRDDPAGALAEHWYARYRGSSMVFRELLPGLASGGATLADARRALGLLRRGGRAAYRGLRSLDAEIVFPYPPCRPPPRPSPRRRPDGDADLFAAG